MNDESGRFVLPSSTYLLIDRSTKLSGVILVAVGLEVGGHTLGGVLLGATGVMLALCTVFLEPAPSGSRNSETE